MPSALPSGELLEQLRWRYAVKRFDPTRKIAADDWRALEEALVLTPSSYGLQPWKFFVICDQPLKDQLVPLSWNQRQLADCSHVVVFAIKADLAAADIDRYLARMAEVRGIAVEQLAGFRKQLMSSFAPPPAEFNVNEWAVRQVYIALGNFMTSAAVLGIDTCPMEGIEPIKYDDLLGLRAKGYATAVVCVAGYRAADDKYAALPKVRFKHEDVIEHLP
ncbi:MAG TPA: NAD(P)H-dependent oxidoreductase [Pirellulaceae bacterium]|nr:NAD(P)H-dependent oxidoreductase [Pirellulaceae bacterium]